MDAPAVVQHLAVCPVIFHQTFFIIEVAAHSLEISCWQQSQNGCLKVSILGIVAAPGHIVGACPDTLQVWRSFAAGGKDLIPSCLENGFQMFVLQFQLHGVILVLVNDSMFCIHLLIGSRCAFFCSKLEEPLLFCLPFRLFIRLIGRLHRSQKQHFLTAFQMKSFLFDFQTAVHCCHRENNAISFCLSTVPAQIPKAVFTFLYLSLEERLAAVLREQLGIYMHSILFVRCPG